MNKLIIRALVQLCLGSGIAHATSISTHPHPVGNTGAAPVGHCTACTLAGTPSSLQNTSGSSNTLTAFGLATLGLTLYRRRPR